MIDGLLPKLVVDTVEEVVTTIKTSFMGMLTVKIMFVPMLCNSVK